MKENPITTEATSQQAERFTIDTREKADWLLKKLAGIEAEEKLIEAQAQKMLEQLRSDRESLLGRFGAELESFTRGETEGGRRKSLTLFHGTVGFRTVPARLVVENQEDALQTARLLAPEAITTVPAQEKLDTRALVEKAKTALETTGEVWPGLKLTETEERFTIKTNTKEKAGASEIAE